MKSNQINPALAAALTVPFVLYQLLMLTPMLLSEDSTADVASVSAAFEPTLLTIMPLVAVIIALAAFWLLLPRIGYRTAWLTALACVGLLLVGIFAAANTGMFYGATLSPTMLIVLLILSGMMVAGATMLIGLWQQMRRES